MNTTTVSNSADQTGWRRIFACDLRSLATMRILLGVLIIVDLAMRSTTMQAMYTNAGFFPIEAWNDYARFVSNTTEPIGWSLHALHGSMAFQIVLFVIAALAAVMLLVGWKTRIACVVSWILLVSLQMRNPLILHSGDALFRMALFWSMFLPLGAVWSFDAKKKARQIRNPAVSGASAGLILTLFSLYFFAGIAKSNPVWFSGEAMEYVLKLDIYTTAFGKMLLGWPMLLKIATWGTLIAELALPILMLVPWKNNLWRYLSFCTFVLLHLSIAACMSIGLFSWVAIAIWTSVLPASFWSRLGDKFRITVPADKRSGNLVWVRMANVFCATLAVYFLLWHIANINYPGFDRAMPQQARFVGKWLNLRQSFVMFDIPPKYSPWFVYEAHLKNGSAVDIFRHMPANHSRPESVLKTIPRHHWRRLHRNLARPAFAEYRKPVSEYLIRRWNETHDEDSQILTERTTVYLEEITPGSESEGMVTQVWHQHGKEIAQRELFDELLKKMKGSGIILP